MVRPVGSQFHRRHVVQSPLDFRPPAALTTPNKGVVVLIYADSMPSSLRLVLLVFLVCSTRVLPASGQAGVTSTPAAVTHFPTSEDLRHLKTLGAPVLSPDGKLVVFTLTEATADGARTHLWVVPASGGPARQLTYSPEADKRGERDVTWAPDGSAVLFLAKRGENMQLFRLPMAGGEASPYDLKVLPAVDDSREKGALPPAKAEDAAKAQGMPELLAIDVSGYAPSLDNHWLALWAADPETPGEKEAHEAKADAVWINHERHGDRLYLVALKPDGSLDGALKPVSLVPDVRGAWWSPQSDRLVAVTEQPNGAGDLGPAGAAWLVSTASLDKPVALAEIPPTVGGNIAWSDDGTKIAFGAQTPEDAPPGYSEVFVLPLPSANSASKAGVKRLLEGFKGTIGFSQPTFLPEGKLLLQASMGTRVAAVKLDLNGKSAPELLPQSTSIVAGLSSNRQQTGWVWLAESSGLPTSLCYARTLGAPCSPLPIPAIVPQPLRSIKAQVVQWKSDGLTIEGLLYLPVAAATKKVPLLLDIHGGPLGAWEDRYEPWADFLLSQGWAILRPNPRGSSAYGIPFAAANKNDLGGGDFRDIMAGLDSVLKSYPLDAEKLALMGYSYGGEMAGFAEGKTDRFKAIISGAPVIDQFSEYGTEDQSWYDRWYFGKPWEHIEDAWRQSPLAGIGKAKTPFLLLQGESDKTDPLGQSLEMYRALRQAGVPVDLVTYPREDHGPLARGIFGYPSPEPWHGFDARQRIVQFLQKAFAEEAK